MKCTFVIMFLILTCFIQAQTNWPIEKIQNNNFSKIFYISESTGWIAGDCGTILKTTNGGDNWIRQETGTNVELHDLYFVNSSFGIAVGDSGITLKTTNGGSTWVKLNSIQSDYENLKCVWFFDESTGLILGNPYLYRTTDGGITWIPYSTLTGVNKFTFYDRNNGTAVGENFDGDFYGKIYVTSDGGKTWIFTKISNPLYDVTYVNANTIVAAGGLVTSYDGGLTWNDLSFAGPFFAVDFFDGLRGIVIGKEDAFYTTDGGHNWIRMEMISNNSITSIAFTNSHTGTAVGINGVILKTTDSGITWSSQSKLTEMELLDVKFINSMVGVACGDPTQILYSKDGGKTWSLLNTGSSNIHHPHLISETEWIALGNDNWNDRKYQILRTTNAGLSWTIVFSTSDFLWSIEFADKNIGICGGEGEFFRTTDGGTIWSEQSLQDSGSHTGNTIYDVNFPSTTIGFMVGGGDVSTSRAGGNFYKTTDSGTSWQYSLLPKQILKSISFPDPLTGYAAGYDLDSNGYSDSPNGIILKTTDAALSWNTIYKGSDILNSITFFNTEQGIAVGKDGVILTTTDAGFSWRRLNGNSNSDLYSVSFINDHTAFITGIGGTMIRLELDNNIPVELVSFTCQVKREVVELNWVTNTELNNKGFEIQRKINNSAWAVAGFINGNGTTSEQHNYSFHEQRLSEENCYYRLKQIDFNGSYKYSDIIEIHNDNNVKEYSLSNNYPNPFNPTTKIKFSLPVQQMVELKVYDILGNEVAVLLRENLPAGNYEKVWDGSSHASGVYYYRIISGAFTLSRKMILLK